MPDNRTALRRGKEIEILVVRDLLARDSQVQIVVRAAPAELCRFVGWKILRQQTLIARKKVSVFRLSRHRDR